MAGEAPELRPEHGHLRRWVMELPDLTLSLYMILLAVLIGLAIYLIDVNLFR